LRQREKLNLLCELAFLRDGLWFEEKAFPFLIPASELADYYRPLAETWSMGKAARMPAIGKI
jgi:hypothetical protein